MDKAEGNEREVSQSLMSRKQSFVGAYLKGDSHLRGYLHMNVPQAPRNATLAEGGGLKKGTNDHEGRRLTSDVSRHDTCLLTDSLLGLLPETCLFLPDLLSLYLLAA